MLYLPTFEMFPNRFVAVELPTKSQIFSRTGKTAVSPAGCFSGEDPCRFGMSTTEAADAFAQAAESYEKPDESKEEKK